MGKRRTQYCKYTGWQLISQPKSGKCTQTNSGVSVRHSCQKHVEKHRREWPAGKTESEIKLLIKNKEQKIARSHCLLWWFIHQKTSQDGASVPGKVWTPAMKTVQPTRAQPSAREWKWKQSRMPSAGLPQDSQTTHATIHTDSMSLRLQKVKCWMEAQSGMCQWSISTSENSCGCTALDMPERREMTSQTGRQNNHCKWLASRKIWSVEELETLYAGTESRTLHHRSSGGERRGKKKH